jgi:hypothetical protein
LKTPASLVASVLEEDPEPSCSHDPAVGYAIAFAVRADVEGIDSACSMRAFVEEGDPDAADVDAVGCTIEDCESCHVRVAERLRRSAARRGGDV